MGARWGLGPRGAGRAFGVAALCRSDGLRGLGLVWACVFAAGAADGGALPTVFVEPVAGNQPVAADGSDPDCINRGIGSVGSDIRTGGRAVALLIPRGVWGVDPYDVAGFPGPPPSPPTPSPVTNHTGEGAPD